MNFDKTVPILLIICGVFGPVTARHQRGIRVERALTFTDDSATGILAAIAIPLNIPEREVFVSYNIEANYGMPVEASDIIPGKLKRLEPAEDVGNQEHEGRKMTSYANDTIFANPHTKSNFFNRQKFYLYLIRNLNAIYPNGKACLLKIICESSYYYLKEYNGWLGDLFHVLLAPSTSEEEPIHAEYYKAEKQGRYSNCEKYEKLCPEDILGMISHYV